MDKQQEHLESLRDIRNMMERSSRFISLSGMSGVIAGVAALAGVAAVYLAFGVWNSDSPYYLLATTGSGEPNTAFYSFIIIDAIVVFSVSMSAAALLTLRKARAAKQPAWDATARRLAVNLAIPLLTGASFCLALLYHNALPLIAPATLIFYGLSLINAGKYTLDDVRHLGIAQVFTGLVAAAYPALGLLLWGFGFGVLHIAYGIMMHYKYER